MNKTEYDQIGSRFIHLKFSHSEWSQKVPKSEASVVINGV